MIRLRVGLSPCPNDTFVFHALLARRIATPGLELDFVLADVEELNRLFLAGELPVSKVSFAALVGRDDAVVLSAGAALGFGVGPVLLAAPATPLARGADGTVVIPRSSRVLAPGAHTTASLLYRLFHPREGRVVEVPFHRVMPALESGEADFGVCIHEGRFTYAARGLALVEDLGARWEREERSPLPLGGIAARAELGPDVHAALEDALRRSLDYARAQPDEALATMRAHAQEDSDDVLWQHVELYVNRFTRELGDEGRAALARLFARARQLP